MQEQTTRTETPEGPAVSAEACPMCGMARDEWRGNGGQGYELGGLIYCCQGCAEGTGCTCQ